MTGLVSTNTGTKVSVGATVTDGETGVTYPITAIGQGAFDGQRMVTELDLSSASNLRLIGDRAFAENQLTQLTIPNSVTTIGGSAFWRNKLTQLTIPNSVTTISGSAFMSNQLTQLTIPNSVTTIRGSAFASNKLTQLTIPNSVTTIGDTAFASNKLTQLTIPNSVTTIGYFAFWRNQLTQLTIPNSVTTIGNRAFEGNQLTQLTIPNSVTTIGNRAFSQNDSLVSVVFLGASPSTFFPKGGSSPGSLGNANPLVYFPKDRGPEGGDDPSFTAPLWQGYDSIRFPQISYDPGASDASGQTESTDPVSAPSSFNGASVPVWDVKVANNGFTRSGYSFTGWNTKADGTGDKYQPGESLTLTGGTDVRLFARWEEDKASTVEVVFDANDGVGSMAPLSGLVGQSLTLPGSKFTRSGYSFTGWNTKADGTGTPYGQGASLVLPVGGVRLYAQWEEDKASTVEVVFDANDGVGSMAPLSGLVGQSLTLPGSKFTRSGYSFTGWNTKADGTGTPYGQGASLVLPVGGVRLYAQWEAAAVIPGDGGNSGIQTGGGVAQNWDDVGPGSASSPSSGQLPWTGVSSMVFGAGIVALFLIGVGVFLVERRRLSSKG